MRIHDGPSTPLPWPGDASDLVAFLPLLWVAWSDGHLEDSELDRIRERIREDALLSENSVHLLESWLRPESPPTPHQMAELRRHIREVAVRVPASERQSLARLGAAMARGAQGEPGASARATEEGLRTLEAVEDLLGVLGAESARVLLSDPTPSLPDRTVPAGPAEERGPGAPGAVSPQDDVPLDVHALRRFLDGRHGDLRTRVFGLMQDPDLLPPAPESAGVGRHDPVPTEAHRAHVLGGLRRLAGEGLGALAYPEIAGGRDDVEGSIVLFETLAHGDLSLLVKYGVQFGLFGGSVLQLGTEVHHRTWLGAIGRLELPGCFAMTEVDHGSNVRDIETVARYLSDEGVFEIHTPHPGARKDWIGNAALHGRLATVFAQLEVGGEIHGVHALLVPLRDDEGTPLPGVTIEDCGRKAGLNGVDNGRIAFDHVRVPRENLLNRFGSVGPDGSYKSAIPSSGRRFFTMLGTLVTGRISIAAAGVSAAKVALAIAVRYSSLRRQFGPSGAAEVPILTYLHQQRLLLPRVAQGYAHHFAVRSLARAHAEAVKAGDAIADETRTRLEVAAAGLKAATSRAALEAIQASREACGGRGYLGANRFGDLRNDVDIFTTFEGANPVLLQLVAKGLLARYREELGEMNLRTIARFLADRAGAEMTRRNPVRSRRTSDAFLLDPATHRDALRFREERLMHTVAGRLKALLDAGVDSFDAMNRCQDHLMALARAHGEAEVLDRFREGIEEAPEGGRVRETLETLAALWALERIEHDRAWFLESGYMEPAQTKAIREIVNRLCGEMAPRAVELVDAFGIPDGVLRAPAAFEG